MTEPLTTMLLRSIRIEKQNISYVKWLLESHDGMATPTTREGFGDVIDLLVAPDFINDFDEFIAALQDEMTVEHVAAPDLPPLSG